MPDSANVYRAISELQTVLTSMIGEARKESHGEHLQVLTHIDKLDDRVRKLETARSDRTPWPPMRSSELVGDERPVFQLTFSSVKRWGIAFGALAALMTAADALAGLIMRMLASLGFHR